MLIYYVQWRADDNTHGKGRVPKDEFSCCCSVLCRDSKDALSCFEWFFRNEYKNSKGYDITDGTISLTRMKVDSRKFDVHYLQMDGIKKPIDLRDVKHSLSQLTCNIY